MNGVAPTTLVHTLTATQLKGEADAMQLKNPQLGIFNMGGTAVANYVSILESLR